MNEPSKWALDAAQSIEGRSYPNSSTIDYVQQAIDAATADKDMGIERLKAEFETGLKIIEEKDKRIAAMAALLDKVKHDYVLITDGNGIVCAVKCALDCPKCSWWNLVKP